MKYYSTNKQAPEATLEEAVVKGLAADKGLFMPFTIKPLPQVLMRELNSLILLWIIMTSSTTLLLEESSLFAKRSALREQ